MFTKKENRIAEYQDELISRHCDEVENIYRQMRGWRHDFHNHIQAIKACVAMGEIDKLSEFCDRLDTDLKEIDSVIKTGCVMLDAILNSKLSLARSKNISVNAKAFVPKEIDIADIDLCVLLGNILDNAIEACEDADNAEKFEYGNAFIRVYIDVKGTQLYICVTNSALKPIRRLGGKFTSTKASASHGFGLLRIDKICSKYSGYCKRNYEPGVFSTEILLPMKR